MGANYGRADRRHHRFVAWRIRPFHGNPTAGSDATDDDLSAVRAVSRVGQNRLRALWASNAAIRQRERNASREQRLLAAKEPTATNEVPHHEAMNSGRGSDRHDCDEDGEYAHLPAVSCRLIARSTSAR
jgi:hypothetical protein